MESAPARLTREQLLLQQQEEACAFERQRPWCFQLRSRAPRRRPRCPSTTMLAKPRRRRNGAPAAIPTSSGTSSACLGCSGYVACSATATTTVTRTTRFDWLSREEFSHAQDKLTRDRCCSAAR